MDFVSSFFPQSKKKRAFRFIGAERSAKKSDTVANSKRGMVVHIPGTGSPSDAARKIVTRICKTTYKDVCRKTPTGKKCKKEMTGKKSGKCTVNVHIQELETNPSGKVKNIKNPTVAKYMDGSEKPVLSYRGKVSPKKVQLGGKVVKMSNANVERIYA